MDFDGTYLMEESGANYTHTFTPSRPGEISLMVLRNFQGISIYHWTNTNWTGHPNSTSISRAMDTDFDTRIFI